MLDTFLVTFSIVRKVKLLIILDNAALANKSEDSLVFFVENIYLSIMVIEYDFCLKINTFVVS